MTIAIADTSFLVATLNRRDAKRNACLAVYQQRWEKIYILEAALAEVAYMIRRESDITTMVGFFKALPSTKYLILRLEMVDIYRAMTVIEQYPALKLDFVDACITAVAERLNITTILTLDKRDFSVIRPRHVDYWTLLP